MKSIKELVEEYNVELVFTTLNKRACFDPTYGIIFVNQNLTPSNKKKQYITS